jgi:hypothetical protein
MTENEGEFVPAIGRLVADIDRRDAETWEMKRMVNKLCGYAGLPPRYPDDPGSGGGGGLDTLKADQFYGKPLATAVREYLEMRGAPNSGGRGAATVKEIFQALKAGGFAFDTKNDDNSMRGLRISLAKNSVTFHKLPGGQFGLLSWYPAAKPPKTTGGEGDTSSDSPFEDIGDLGDSDETAHVDPKKKAAKTEAATTKKVAAAS